MIMELNNGDSYYKAGMDICWTQSDPTNHIKDPTQPNPTHD